MGEKKRIANRAGYARWAALVASGLIHVALVAWLIFGATAIPPVTPTPHLEITLTAPPRPKRVDRPSPPPARRATSPLDARSPATTNPSAAPTTAAASPQPSRIGQDDIAARVRQAIGARDCNRPGLSREGREQCETQRWAGLAPSRIRPNLDPNRRYIEDPTPYLVRRPKDGCRIRATGDEGPLGDDSNARAGVTCVVPF